MSNYVRHPLGLPPANPAMAPEMEPAERFTERFHMRITPEQKASWMVAAGAMTRPLSEWVRDRLDEASESADDDGSGGFTQRRLTIARGIAVDLVELRESYGVRNPALAAALKRIEDRVDTLEGMIR